MSFIESVKVLLSDKRGRALVKFGIYIFFMIFVIFYIKGMHKEQPIIEEDPYISQTSYKENIKFLDKEYELEAYDSIIKFKNDTEEYTVENGILYKDKEVIEYEFYFWNLTPSFIGELVSNKEAYSETKYKDSSIETTYEISLEEFVKKFKCKPLLLDSYDDKNVIVKIKKQEEKIVSVYIDLSNYYYDNLEVYITY